MVEERKEKSNVIANFLGKYNSQDRMENYCYRHHPDVSCNRQADAAKMQEIQQSLDELSPTDQEAITHVWSMFSAAPSKQRTLILQGLLAQCCFPQLSHISGILKDLIRIDFLTALPPEISFKILCYLDTASLCRAAQVCRRWRELADDDVVWHRMCEQHIDKKCTKCGWGLPLLEKKRLRDSKRAMLARAKNIDLIAATSTPPVPSASKREREDYTDENGEDNTKKLKQQTKADYTHPMGEDATAASITSVTVAPPVLSATPVIAPRKTRPWKDVYSERFKIERNWRNGRYKVKEFKDTKSVLCLQFDDQYLITGAYDGQVKVWDVETGQVLRTLVGHVRGVNALKFDSSKLITGSSDHTVRIWNYRTGDCISTFRGHEEQVLCLDFDQKLIASGSADNNIKVWNFEQKLCFTLRGHKDWVHGVKIHSVSGTLYSASEDTTIRMWDLETRRCIRIFGGPGQEDIGHVAQVQCVLPLTLDHLEDSGHDGANGSNGNCQGAAHGAESESDGDITEQEAAVDAVEVSEAIEEIAGSVEDERLQFENNVVQRRSFSVVDGVGRVGREIISSYLSNTNNTRNPAETPASRMSKRKRRPTHLLSSSLDNTIKLWDIKTGECVRTIFGHVEGVWAVAADNFRIVSGAHDKLVKVWDLQSGRCWHTFSGHTKPVCCVGLSDTRFASGSDDGVVKMYCFDDFD